MPLHFRGLFCYAQSMKKSPLYELIISVLLGLVMVTSASAAGTKTYKPKPVPTPQPTVISNVGPSSVTVTDEKGTKTFTITQFTEISVNGQRATATDLKPGMTVTVTMGTDATRASRIAAADPPASKKK
jgi:hypothetical protein